MVLFTHGLKQRLQYVHMQGFYSSPSAYQTLVGCCLWKFLTNTFLLQAEIFHTCLFFYHLIKFNKLQRIIAFNIRHRWSAFSRNTLLWNPLAGKDNPPQGIHDNLHRTSLFLQSLGKTHQILCRENLSAIDFFSNHTGFFEAASYISMQYWNLKVADTIPYLYEMGIIPHSDEVLE